MAEGNPPEPFLEAEFEEATKVVRGRLAATAGQEDLLYFYARFKQAKEGSCSTPKPSFYQLAEKAKWSAWSGLGNMGRTEAMHQYVERVGEVLPGWREEVVREPTEGWVTVSSPVKAEEASALTLWDLVKEGSLPQLAAVLDTLQTQVSGELGERVELGLLKDPQGLTLLHWAADRGQVEMARLLLERDDKLLDLQDSEGQTALHYAASCGHLDMVRLLLSSGADREVADEEGATACNQETEEAVRRLFHEKSN